MKRIELSKIRRAVLIAFIATTLASCRKGPSESVQLLPTTKPAARNLEHAVSITIDGEPLPFPAVEFRAQATGNGVAVQISTPTADVEKQNSFNFELILEDVEDPANLAGAAWHFTTDDPERSDTLNGLTLNGGMTVLEPTELHFRFGSEPGGKLAIELEGQFRWFDPPDSEMPLKVVGVRGKFTVPEPKAE